MKQKMPQSIYLKIDKRVKRGKTVSVAMKKEVIGPPDYTPTQGTGIFVTLHCPACKEALMVNVTLDHVRDWSK